MDIVARGNLQFQKVARELQNCKFSFGEAFDRIF